MPISPIGPGGAGATFGPDETADAPEIASIGERVDVIRRIPWRAEIRALLEAENIVLGARDVAVSSMRALLSNPLRFGEERARLLAEKDPSIEVKTRDGRELVTNDMASGGRYVKLYRPSGRNERPLYITELEVRSKGDIEVKLGVHDSNGPLGFRNLDLVARTLDESGAIIDAAQASPRGRDDARTQPRLQMLEDKMAEVAGEVSRLKGVLEKNPGLRDVRTAYRAALDAKTKGDPNDKKFEEAQARVRAALPRMGLSAADQGLVRRELDLCREIRDKWVAWHGDTGMGVVIP